MNVDGHLERATLFSEASDSEKLPIHCHFFTEIIKIINEIIGARDFYWQYLLIYVPYRQEINTAFKWYNWEYDMQFKEIDLGLV